jgi:hypothetical protein
VHWFVIFRRTLYPLLGLTPQSQDFFRTSQKDAGTKPRKPKKIPFYAHIARVHIPLYQSYFDRALALSSTLEFGETDPRFNKLLDEAAANDSLSEIDLELMRLQYVCADRSMREKRRSCWVETVLKRRDGDFFPDPWAILSALFASGPHTMREFSTPVQCVHGRQN